MKALVVLVLLSLVAPTLYAECEIEEAQVIAHVRDLELQRIDQGVLDCTYRIEVVQYRPSVICPLALVEIENHQFRGFNCWDMREGQLKSGVLVKDKEHSEIYWD